MKGLFSAVVFAAFMTYANANTVAVEPIKSGKVLTKKDRFAESMIPLIKKANEAILAEREVVMDFFEKFKQANNINEIDQKSIEKMFALAKKYDISSIFNEQTFKKRVAPVPASLALTQAAIETGWGSSKFFKEANNAFGQWTYSKTNGIVPSKREKGKTHRIRAFDSVQDSVNAYMLNLNRNDAYADFRDLRYILGSDFNGLIASTKMLNYSQQKEQYVKKLRSIMTNNEFLRYDYL